jgi:hypothetical protein
VLVRAATELRSSGLTFGGGQATPTRGQQAAHVRISGTVRDVQFVLLSSSATILEPVALSLEDEGEDSRTYAGDLTPPTVPFRFAITGTDANGFRFQRVDERLMSPAR